MLGKPRIYLFSPARLIYSINFEHSCKILFLNTGYICVQHAKVLERANVTAKKVPKLLVYVSVLSKQIV